MGIVKKSVLLMSTPSVALTKGTKSSNIRLSSSVLSESKALAAGSVNSAAVLPTPVNFSRYCTSALVSGVTLTSCEVPVPEVIDLSKIAGDVAVAALLTVTTHGPSPSATLTV